jgi:hypothetical protein
MYLIAAIHVLTILFDNGIQTNQLPTSHNYQPATITNQLQLPTSLNYQPSTIVNQ